MHSPIYRLMIGVACAASFAAHPCYCQQVMTPPVHNAYELLGETELFRIHASGRYTHCQSAGADIALVFKVDEGYVIKNDDAYWSKIEQQVVPLLDRSCDSPASIRLDNYVEGYRLSSDIEYMAGRAGPNARQFALYDARGGLPTDAGVFGTNYPNMKPVEQLELPVSSASLMRLPGRQPFKTFGVTTPGADSEIGAIAGLLKAEGATVPTVMPKAPPYTLDDLERERGQYQERLRKARKEQAEALWAFVLASYIFGETIGSEIKEERESKYTPRQCAVAWNSYEMQMSSCETEREKWFGAGPGPAGISPPSCLMREPNCPDPR